MNWQRLTPLHGQTFAERLAEILAGPPSNAPDLCATCGAYWSCEHASPEFRGLEVAPNAPTYRDQYGPHDNAGDPMRAMAGTAADELDGPAAMRAWLDARWARAHRAPAPTRQPPPGILAAMHNLRVIADTCSVYLLWARTRRKSAAPGPRAAPRVVRAAGRVGTDEEGDHDERARAPPLRRPLPI